jgi:hypothetical protein
MTQINPDKKGSLQFTNYKLQYKNKGLTAELQHSSTPLSSLISLLSFLMPNLTGNGRKLKGGM